MPTLHCAAQTTKRLSLPAFQLTMHAGTSDNDFSYARFDAALGDRFEVTAFGHDGAEHVVFLKLATLTRKPSPPNYEQFAALFVGPQAPDLAQGSYAIQSERFGVSEVFLVPVGRDAEQQMRYEACIVREAVGDGSSPHASDGFANER